MSQLSMKELALAEQSLIEAATIEGSIEERMAHNKSIGAFDSWGEILGNYIAYLESPTDADEALKRALFLIWYAFTKPAMLTGLGEFGLDKEAVILQDLERRFSSNALDCELQTMLKHYGFTQPFSNHLENIRLNFHLVSAGWYCADKVHLGEMDLRGYMGEYWQEQMEKTPVEVGSSDAESAKALCMGCFSPLDMTVDTCPTCGRINYDSVDFPDDD